MRNLIRSPLTWMVLAEIVVVATLIVLAWNALASAALRPGSAAPLVTALGSGAETPSPVPELPVFTRPASNAPLPGLNVDPVFWLRRLDSLNHDQVFFEQLEWRLVHTATDAAQRYVETVVLPSVERAEK